MYCRSLESVPVATRTARFRQASPHPVLQAPSIPSRVRATRQPVALTAAMPGIVLLLYVRSIWPVCRRFILSCDLKCGCCCELPCRIVIPWGLVFAYALCCGLVLPNHRPEQFFPALLCWVLLPGWCIGWKSHFFWEPPRTRLQRLVSCRPLLPQRHNNTPAMSCWVVLTLAWQHARH